MSKTQRNGPPAKEKGDPPVWSKKHWTGTANVEAAVFERMIEKDGEEFRVFNTVLKRSFKEGDEYKSGNTFRPEDLLVAAAFLQEAFSYVSNEMSKR